MRYRIARSMIPCDRPPPRPNLPLRSDPCNKSSRYDTPVRWFCSLYRFVSVIPHMCSYSTAAPVCSAAYRHQVFFIRAGLQLVCWQISSVDHNIPPPSLFLLVTHSDCLSRKQFAARGRLVRQRRRATTHRRRKRVGFRD